MIREVKEIEESTLWEETGRQLAERGKAEDSRRTVIFVLGERGAGKSALIRMLRNDFDPETKPNVLVEYWPARIGRQKKQLLHFYEIGSPHVGAFLGRFGQRADLRVICLVCVDLGRGSQLVQTTGKWLELLRQNLKGSNSKLESVRSEHEDGELMSGLSVQTAIVGCKFDLFEKMDLESRKWISRGLRYLAHTNSCSLLSCSSRNNQLGLALRAQFSDFLDPQANPPARNIKDPSKPLFVRFGDDRVSDMNLPSSGSLSNLQVLEKQLESVPSRGEERAKAVARVGEEVGRGRLQEALVSRRKELAKMAQSHLPQQKPVSSTSLV